MRPPTEPVLFYQFSNRLANAIERILAIVLVGCVILNFVNVVGRYVFDAVLLSADELQTFGLIVITFLGAAVVTWRGQHLRMDILANQLRGRKKMALALLDAAVSIAVVGFACVQSFRYVKNVFNLGAFSDMAHIPMWIPHSAVLVGFALIAVGFAVRTYRLIMMGDERTQIERPLDEAGR
jgi:TRAP-type C4-dicarboxylate transport system permease small subunit